MSKNKTELLAESKRLSKENKSLHRQLQEARNSIEAIKTGNIDALIITNKDDLKVYTENAADKTYRILIEKMNEGAVALDENGMILYCNSCFAKMVQLPLQKVIGRALKNFISSSSMNDFVSLLKQGGRHASKQESNIRTRDNKIIPVQLSVNSFSPEHTLMLSIIITDLTAQKKNQKELKRRTIQLEQINAELIAANKELVSFAFVSGHHLQEPLRKIQTFSSCILSEEEGHLSENAKGYFNRMNLAAQMMRELIQDHLTFSEISNGERRFEKLDLGIILEEVKQDYSDIIIEKKATITISTPIEIRIIRFQFRLLLANLISNSLKFSSPERKLRVNIKRKIVVGKESNETKLTPGISYCQITYTDNGLGFEPQYNELVFEIFQRLHGPKEYKGTGMGLSMCRRIVENHRGLITASGQLNKGARFDIYIPVSL